MVRNTAIQLAAGKLTSASLVPGSLFLLGGIVVWQLWRKQVQLQDQSNDLSTEIEDVKKQLARINKSSKADGESVVHFSSYLKEKMTGINLPWSTAK